MRGHQAIVKDASFRIGQVNSSYIITIIVVSLKLLGTMIFLLTFKAAVWSKYLKFSSLLKLLVQSIDIKFDIPEDLKYMNGKEKTQGVGSVRSSVSRLHSNY